MQQYPGSGGKYVTAKSMDNHKTRSSPDVDFSRDGQVYVTHQDGTFPLRSKPAQLDEDRNFTVSGLDFDSIYDRKPKRYKKRQPLPREYAAEAAVIAGGINGSTGNTTISSGTSSLGRKVRQKKRRKHDLQRAFDSVRSSSSVDYGYMDYNSLGRSFGSRRSVSSESMEKLQIKANSDSGSLRDEHIQLPYIPGSKVRPRKRTNEPVPFVIFLLLGTMLLILGLSRLLVCWWHQYGCSLWTGTLCLALGILGMYHRGDYKHRHKNPAYIAVAFVNSLAALTSCGLVLSVLFPTIRGLVQNMSPQEVVYAVHFSSLNGSLVPIAVNYNLVVYISMGLDVTTLSVLLIDFCSIKAFFIVANNHWDAVYDVTGDCDHRGHPKHFNPIHQTIVGLATSLLGIIVSVIMTSPVNHGWSLVWAGLVVMVGGLVCTAHCKRCDLAILGMVALGSQIASLLAICVSAVMITVSMVDDINVIYTEGAYILSGRMWDLSASIFFQSVYLVSTIIDIVFILGCFFRCCRFLCVNEPSGLDTEL